MKSKEIESRIEISKRNGDYYRKLSQKRNFTPDLTMPNCLPDNSKRTKQMKVDDVLIK